MKGINKVILIGHVGQDPESKSLPSGSAVTNLSLATTESWKDKSTGQLQDKTEWHKIVFFGKVAEIAAQYLKKGSKVYIEGSLRTRKWQDKDGSDRYTTEIVASEMQMLDNKPDSKPAPAPARKPVSQSNMAVMSQNAGDEEDSIPF